MLKVKPSKEEVKASGGEGGLEQDSAQGGRNEDKRRRKPKTEKKGEIRGQPLARGQPRRT